VISESPMPSPRKSMTFLAIRDLRRPGRGVAQPLGGFRFQVRREHGVRVGDNTVEVDKRDRLFADAVNLI